ncbi:hypothetical protein GZL_04663 [Streptomyces sp. 769]|nr:hypothetical protein GZL_04663 [Streptomyces sp. 769]
MHTCCGPNHLRDEMNRGVVPESDGGRHARHARCVARHSSTTRFVLCLETLK